jgi:cytoskeletal protein CcmA (bactofilin family)
MTRTGREGTAALLAGLIVLFTTTRARAVGGESVRPKPPAAPEAPAPQVPTPPAAVPPMPPRPGARAGHPSSSVKRYYLGPGDTHKGDLYFMSESVEIAGKQEGDLSLIASDLTISGTVTGDINATVESADLSGKMGDTVRVFCKELTVTGHIDGDLIAVCASVIVDRDARVTGDVDAKGANVEIRGVVDGDVDATGGSVTFSGQAGGNATLKADVVEIDPGAKIDGSLEYASRERLDIDTHKVVKGTVTYSPEKPKPAVSRWGFTKWFFLMATTLLAGLGMLALFRQSAPGIIALVRADGLKSAGIGFIAAIVVPVAAAISCILIITIPAAILVFLAYALLMYLSQVPVAVLLGEMILKRFGHAVSSPFLALVVGVPVLYIVFAIPVIGKIALFATLFTGFGAIVIGIWAARQARRAGPAGPEPPLAPMPAV